MAKGDTCDTCGGSGKITVQAAPFGKVFPASDRKHVQTKKEKVTCPTCHGSGKQS